MCKNYRGEIFKRLDATDSDVKSLFDLKDFIYDSVKWFYTKNEKKFTETLLKIKDLDNYRTTLFKDDDSELLDTLTDFIEKTIPMIDEEFKNI